MTQTQAIVTKGSTIAKRAARLARRGVQPSESLPALSRLYDARDPLALRAMWRRASRRLEVRATCVGGRVERFLSP
jgi:hypothetical protein